jgi:hypothetical protein
VILNYVRQDNENSTTKETKKEQDRAKTDYQNLPLPCKYENLQTEMLMSLKADFFEGARFDYNKQLNQKFFLSHGERAYYKDS